MSLSQSTPIPRSPSSSSSLGSPLGAYQSGTGGGSYQPLCFHKDVFSIFPPTTTNSTSNAGVGTEGGGGFDVDGFIAECRKRVPLESVLNDLRAYGVGLDHDLVELINKDYAEFVSLSSNLIGIDHVLVELREPLDLILQDAKGFSTRVTGIITHMEEKMKQRDDIAIRKEYLTLFINISNSIEKLENLLLLSNNNNTTTLKQQQQQSQSTPTTTTTTATTNATNKSTTPPQQQGTPSFTALVQQQQQQQQQSSTTTTPAAAAAAPATYEDTTQVVYMERLTTEYNMLRFYLARAQKFPPALLLDKFSQKVNALVTSLDKETSKTFRTSIMNSKSGSGGGSGLVGPCLRMYSALNKASSAYAIYREVVVKPRVQQIVTVANLEKGTAASSAATTTRGSCEGLKGIFSSLLDFVKNECCPFLEEVRQSAVEYDFLANSIWAEIEETISAKIGKIYAPGIPEIFHQNYKASTEFLSQLEAIACSSFSSLQSFRSHPSYANFESRWITSVYFQLRFTDIASKVETALSQQQQLTAKTTPTTTPPITATESTDSDNKKDPHFKLYGTTVLWRELTRIWSPNVYIFSLTRQFMKLSLQLLSRYSSWIYASYATTVPHIPIGSPIIGGTNNNNEALKDSAGVNLKENVDDAAVSLWNQFPAEDFPHIYYDVQTLAANLQQGGQLMTSVASAIPDDDDDASSEELVSTLIKESFAAAATTLLSHQPYISSRVVTHLTKKGIENLQPLLGVTTTYRLTDKQAPTRANYYVANVVSILENFLLAHTITTTATPLSPSSSTASSSHQQQQLIPQPILKDWIRRVLEDVTNRYEEMVSETLNQALKAEVLLNKMVKKKAQSNKGEGAISDIDKISLQLFLDVTKYGQLLKDKLHIDPSTFPPYTRLLKCVSAGEKFKTLVHESNV